METITNNNIQIDYFTEVMRNGWLMETWSIGNNDYKFNQIGYKLFSTLTVYSDGKRQWTNKGTLSNITTIDDIDYRADTEISFNYIGTVSYGTIDKDTLFSNFNIPEGSKVWLRFNGKISKCRLSKDITIDGITYKKGDTINFNLSGKIRNAYKSLLD